MFLKELFTFHRLTEVEIQSALKGGTKTKQKQRKWFI